MTDQEQLASFLRLLSYNPDTGLFTWLVSRGKAKAGDIAGSPWKDGYLRIKVLRRGYAAHRLAWLFAHGHWPQLQIDHINGIRTDNRIHNLRDVDGVVNQSNRIFPSRGNVYPNVQQAPCGRFNAVFTYNKQFYWLGSHVTAEEAYAAVLKRRAELIDSKLVDMPPTGGRATEFRVSHGTKFCPAEPLNTTQLIGETL